MISPRITLAAPKSGSGKTLITCAMLRALSLRGKKAQAFKCGPDYIDPMFHQKVIGVPSRNLDLFFTGEEETRALFLEDNDADVSVIEGVMGLYDGLAGTQEEASTYHLSRVLQSPVILILNARGMGRSILAEIAGFQAMDREGLIRGVILNQVTESFYKSIAPLIEEERKIKALGYFPMKKDLELQSRYLGLKLPGEIGELQEKVTEAAKILEETVALDRILEIAEEQAREYPLTAKSFSWLSKEQSRDDKGDEGKPCADSKKVRIGVALDEAFCFYYEDNFRLLRNAGAELIFFSPLHDKKLPANLQGILLGGGYPELLAKELSANEPMREAIRNAIENGMPSLAECGGFMYLHDAIVAEDGTSHPMAGVLHGSCKNAGKLVRFGYASFQLPAPLDPKRPETNEIRGHEFHYYDSDVCGEDLTAVKPVTGRSWKCGHFGENRLWCYGHLYYPSQPEFAAWFVRQCDTYQRG